jgi:hypothetical protein
MIILLSDFLENNRSFSLILKLDKLFFQCKKLVEFVIFFYTQNSN